MVCPCVYVCVCVCFLFRVRALGAWFYCRRRFQVLFHNYLFVCGFQSCGGGDKQHLSLSLLSCHGLSSQRETHTETQRESKGLKKSSEKKSCSSGRTSCCCSTSCRFYILCGCGGRGAGALLVPKSKRRRLLREEEKKVWSRSE